MKTLDGPRTAADAAREVFLQHFATASHRCDYVAIVKAQEALKSAYDLYAPIAANANLATTYFAGHGIDHATSLAKLTTEIVTKVRTKEQRDHPFGNIDFLLLLYAALLFHDIGMSIPGDSHTSLD